MRCLPNPNWQSELRDLTGLASPVQEFLRHHPIVEEMYQSTRNYLDQWVPRYAEGSRTAVLTGRQTPGMASPVPAN